MATIHVFDGKSRAAQKDDEHEMHDACEALLCDGNNGIALYVTSDGFVTMFAETFVSDPDHEPYYALRAPREPVPVDRARTLAQEFELSYRIPIEPLGNFDARG